MKIFVVGGCGLWVPCGGTAAAGRACRPCVRPPSKVLAHHWRRWSIDLGDFIDRMAQQAMTGARCGLSSR